MPNPVDPLLLSYSLGRRRVAPAGDVNVTTPVGSLTTAPTSGEVALHVGTPSVTTASDVFWGVARVVSVGLCAYHGAKRNNSIAWGVGWAIMGGVAPIIAPAIAIAQGLGEPLPEATRAP